MVFEETKAKYQKFVKIRIQIAVEYILSDKDEPQKIDEHHPMLQQFTKCDRSLEQIYLYMWRRKYGIKSCSI